jgi:hypothetical protein
VLEVGDDNQMIARATDGDVDQSRAVFGRRNALEKAAGFRSLAVGEIQNDGVALIALESVDGTDLLKSGCRWLRAFDTAYRA